MYLEEEVVTFVKGQSGNPMGRPKGSTSPWTQVKNLLIKAYEENPQALEDDLLVRYEAGPVDYLERYLFPFMPRSLEIEHTEVKGVGDRVIEANATLIDIKKNIGSIEGE